MFSRVIILKILTKTLYFIYQLFTSFNTFHYVHDKYLSGWILLQAVYIFHSGCREMIPVSMVKSELKDLLRNY